MKVLFVSPEVSPLVRTGGLGDVVGSLPLALKKIGLDVRVICPMHRECNNLAYRSLNKSFNLGSATKPYEGNLVETSLGVSEVPVYLIKNSFLYDRPGIYSDENGNYEDNPERVFALCRAALKVEDITNWKPDVFHAHDWMAAPTCAFLNAKLQSRKQRPDQASVLTIHNLEHQGSGTYDHFKRSGLPLDYWNLGFDQFGSLNLLKSGIQHADKITTVSPTYSREIRQDGLGHGLEGSLQYRGADLLGILNGIDEKSWNPMKDSSLPAFINPEFPKEGKISCKNSLLKEMNLVKTKKSPLFGIVSRLCKQKGLDLLLKIFPSLLRNSNAQFVLLGSGSEEQEVCFMKLAQQHPQRFAAFIGFNDRLARRIFAGSDFFLMPSRYEPCGLAQQYAMRYGSIPIARRTGGLADTIKDFNDSKPVGNGFLFDDPDPHQLLKVIHKALEIFKNDDLFQKVRKNALSSPCSWENAAKQYAQVYNWSMEKNLISKS